MKTVQISLNSIGKVKSFVNTISQFDYDFDLISGRYVIDADWSFCSAPSRVDVRQQGGVVCREATFLEVELCFALCRGQNLIRKLLKRQTLVVQNVLGVHDLFRVILKFLAQRFFNIWVLRELFQKRLCRDVLENT